MFKYIRRQLFKRTLIIDTEKKILAHEIDINIAEVRDIPKIKETVREAMREVSKTAEALSKAKKELKGKSIKRFEVSAQQAQSYLEMMNKVQKEVEAKRFSLLKNLQTYESNLRIFKSFPW